MKVVNADRGFSAQKVHRKSAYPHFLVPMPMQSKNVIQFTNEQATSAKDPFPTLLEHKILQITIKISGARALENYNTGFRRN